MPFEATTNQPNVGNRDVFKQLSKNQYKSNYSNIEQFSNDCRK